MKLYDSSPLISQGIAPMSEPVTVTYLDLDRLIDKCELTKLEQLVLDLLMRGYTRSDIRDDTNLTMETIISLLTSAVEKIVEMNEYEWHRSHRQIRRDI